MNINVGILGFAHAHVHSYCGRWREHPEMGIQVVAGWDHDAARLADAAKTHGFTPVESVDALLDRVDAVVIASETVRHAELVDAAARAGKAIVLQKPMALTLEQADRMVDAVRTTGVPFTLAWQMRVDPHNQLMKAMIGSGEFGKVMQIRRRHCLSTHLWEGFEKSWHVDPAQNRDIFADDAAHPTDFIYWMLGMPRTVVAELGTLVNPAIPNDNGIALFRYADGAFAEISCCFAALGGENITEITCERGTIVQNFGDAPSTNTTWPPGGIQFKWMKQGDSAWTVSDLPNITNHGERIAGLAGPIAEFLRGERPPIATVEEGRDVLRMILACYDANAQGRRVTI
jgi:predicted dehydrogenase